MRMIFLFVDGVGLGEKDKNKNPFLEARTPSIDYIFKQFRVMPTDARLDVPGLPQSATGQTTIFTGVNASKVLGRHLHGQPTITLKKLIFKNNLFKELINMGFKVANSNVYRTQYIEKILDPTERKFRPSVTTVMTLSAGLSLRTVEDYLEENGVYHDITGSILVEGGYVKYTISPQEAAQRIFKVSRNYDFTLFEHFMTDIVGHTKDMERAIETIELLDSLIGELLNIVDLREDIIVITSDHGNIEDMTVKTHTLNKVPTFILGNVPKGLDIKIDSLTDITPAVIEIFSRRT